MTTQLTFRVARGVVWGFIVSLLWAVTQVSYAVLT